MRIRSDDTGKQPAVPSSLPFPAPSDDPGPPSVTVGDRFGLAALADSAEAIFSAVDEMSRRIDDLALGALSRPRRPGA